MTMCQHAPFCATPHDLPLSVYLHPRTPAMCHAHVLEAQGDQALREGLPRTARFAYEQAAARVHAHTHA